MTSSTHAIRTLSAAKKDETPTYLFDEKFGAETAAHYQQRKFREYEKKCEARKKAGLPPPTCDVKKEIPALVDLKGDTQLHIHARRSNADDLSEYIARKLDENTFFLIHELQTHNKAGATPLHDVVRYNSVEAIAAFVKSSGTYLPRPATTCDLKGNLPIHLVSDFKDPQHAEIRKLLSPATFATFDPLTVAASSLRSLSKEIKAQEIFERDNIDEESKLAKLIENICKVVNDARKQIQVSYTHPDANQLPDDKYFDCVKRVNQMRTQIAKKTGTGNYYEVKDWQCLKEMVDFIKTRRSGNCVEFAYYTLYHLYEQYQIRGEVCQIGKGNHFFVVVNRAANSDIHRPETWGPRAMVIDTFRGDVFLASDINARLQNYYSYCDGSIRRRHIYGGFNPQYHTIETMFQTPNFALESKASAPIPSTKNVPVKISTPPIKSSAHYPATAYGIRKMGVLAGGNQVPPATVATHTAAALRLLPPKNTSTSSAAAHAQPSNTSTGQRITGIKRKFV